MPTYEYLCQTCSHRFEQWQKMTDEPLTICPECGGHIRRLFFPAGIVFKGPGFYKTDHAANSVASSNGHKQKEESESKSADTKTANESKPTEGSSSTTNTKTSDSKVPTSVATK